MSTGDATRKGPSRPKHPDNGPPAELRRDHATAQLEAHIRQIVDASPRLSRAQKDRLAVLLRATPTGDDVSCDRPTHTGTGMQRGRSTTPNLRRQKKAMRAMKHASERKGQ